ncbi:MAG: hypothetical protein ACTSSE_09690 [Candidatus Thorarchaeota archaeon]
MDKSCNVTILEYTLSEVYSLRFDEDNLLEEEDWDDDEWEDDDDDW